MDNPHKLTHTPSFIPINRFSSISKSLGKEGRIRLGVINLAFGELLDIRFHDDLSI